MCGGRIVCFGTCFFGGDKSAALPRSFKLAINSMVFWKKTVFLVWIYNQQFRWIIILMVFDFRGYDMYMCISAVYTFVTSVPILYSIVVELFL